MHPKQCTVCTKQISYKTSNLEKGNLSGCLLIQEISTEDNTIIIRDECKDLLRQFLE
jgi:hypothetical protein